MKGVTALIISSLHGLGLDIVRTFAKQGCNIVLNGYHNQTEDIIQNEYQLNKTICLSADMQNEIDLYNLVEQTLHRFQRIDVLIINNECRRHYRASIDEFPVEKWRDIIDNNLISNFALVKTLWPHMKRQHFGRIITIANEHSVIASEYKSACIASHHAMLGLNKALAIEGAPFGITSNIICPGYTQTNFLDQYNHIETLADLVLFLTTDQAHSITGQSISWTFEKT